MSVSQGIVPLAEIRFADGKPYWMVPSTASDLLLHPVFLKFFASCLVIYALLDVNGTAQSAGQAGFALAAVWALVGVVAMLWIAAVFTVLRWLWRRGYVRVVYTPCVTLPLFLASAVATHFLLVTLTDWPRPVLADWINGLVRDMFVILIMDMLFGNFVAPQHPSFLSRAPSEGGEAAVAATPARIETARPQAEDEVVAPETAAPVEATVRIGTEDVLAGELVYIRAEDHYLRVVTTKRRLLTRGRLSDALAQLDFRSGIQVNRSTWVAFAAIEAVDDDAKGILTLTLAGGEAERVAQSRRIAFQAAMSAWANPATTD